MTTLGKTGERAVIRRLGRLLSLNKSVVVGIGDDCAVLRSPSDKLFDLVMTSDPVIENVHFQSGENPGLIGRKAAGRVLSDLAAMGSEPQWALVDLVAPAKTSLATIEGVYRGLAAMAGRHGLAVVGGDTTRGLCLELHVFAVGRVPHGRAILRSGAKAGDVIYSTGSLGGSLAGRHLRFEPRLEQGKWLSRSGWASAMIDLSDGLASDLRRLTEMSGTGATIDTASIPVSSSALRVPSGRSKLEHALYDGEDYELLLTVPARKALDFEHAWRKDFRLKISRWGVMTHATGKICCVAPDGGRTMLKDGGYEHFLDSDPRSR